MMNHSLRLYVPVYSITLLLSAFLLFGIQPMFGKMILPLLGGAPAVWNTAMVFFQAMLLAGYGYAHLSARYLPMKLQAVLHFLLLLFFVFVLPISIPAGWEPPSDSANPALWQLGMMTVVVGGPFFVLSGSAPLFQHWFARTDHKDAHNPYFLYAASNLGSMTALLTYPFITEPLLTLSQQSAAWAAGYVALMAAVILCAALVWRKSGDADHLQADSTPAPTGRQRLYWLVLALVPSSLMLGVTTYITTDMAAVPLLWILPLALYVGTFIIVFARSFRLPMNKVMILHGLLLAVAIASFIHPFPFGKVWLLPVHLMLFFVSALICHQVMADSRPSAARLTEFYLIMSLGGVLGGILNALVAPVVFLLPVEYALALAVVCYVRYADGSLSIKEDLKENWWAIAGAVFFCMLTLFLQGQKSALFVCIVSAALFLIYLSPRRWSFAFAVTALLFLYPGFNWLSVGKLLFIERNFFGVSRVYDTSDGAMRIYMHGMTSHGAQMLIPDYRLTPITYYNEGASVGDAFHFMDTKSFPQNIAVLGLGIGSLACFQHEGRHYDFYEIDPDVKRIAEDKNLYTFLSDCGSPYDIILGDGRLKIAAMPDETYDMIVIDVFSSDNIPAHILTREAFEIYLKKLKPDGVILANISNNFLDLTPVVAAVAKSLDITALFKISLDEKIGDTEIRYAPSIFSVMARRSEDLGALPHTSGWRVYRGGGHDRVWTDDYVSVVSAFWPKGRPSLCKEGDVPYHCDAQNRTEKSAP